MRADQTWRLDERGPILNRRRPDLKGRAQETLELDLLRAIEHRMSGRFETRIVGSLSYNRFAVGALASKPHDGIENYRDALRRPRSTGARFLIPKTKIGAAKLDIKLDYCVFYPVYPTWPEVKHLMERGSVKDAEVDLKSCEQQLKLHFEQLQVDLGAIWNEPTKSRSWKLKELDDARVQVSKDPRALLIKPDDGRTRYFKRVQRFVPNQIFEEADQSAFFEAWRQGLTGQPIVPNWQAVCEVTVTDQGDSLEVAVVFTNESQQEEGATETKSFLHDCRFSVNLSGTSFVPQPLQGAALGDYRSQPTEDATGIHCCVRSESGNRVYNLPVPSFVLPHTDPNVEYDSQCRFGALAEPNCIGHLETILQGMQQYQAKWRSAKKDLLGARLGDPIFDKSFEGAIQDFESEMRRFAQGIRALREDPRALLSFRLLNRAMQYANSKSHSKKNEGFEGWRTFQLVFLVSTLKDVVVREHPEWTDMDGRDHVDVVWVATGGGKTETYLGLIGFTLLFDRMRGKHRGLSAWVKFPLRMLSLDQLDRFAKLILVLQRVATDEKLPGDPFAIGYYMGDANTPNSFNVAEQYQRYGKSPKQIGDELAKLQRAMPGETKAAVSHRLFESKLSETDAKRYRLMTNCPARDCEERVHIWVDNHAERATINCPVHGELPIYFVDDEIYRRVPSVIISTIDKLAILAFNEEVRNIIVRPYGHCKVHGYYASPSVAKDTCKGCKYGSGDSKDNLRKVPPEEFYDPTPAIQVQDELHLLKEQLGSYDSHYEGLIDHLHGTLLRTDPGFRIQGAKGRTKIIGATATISDYERQVSQLYGRTGEPRRFPVLGMKAGASFYMAQTPDARRVLASLWSVNMTMPTAHDEVILAYWARVLSFQNDLKLLREMLIDSGISRTDVDSLEDSALRDILDLASTSLSYFQNKQKAFQRIQDLKSYLPKGATEYFQPLIPLFAKAATAVDSLTGDNNFQEIRNTKTRLESKYGSDKWIAHLAATSIISHGVDVSRLNFIVFAGQPTETAEYIQASSRVGRRHVGVSLVLSDTLHDRDELHFINHVMYHKYQDSFVSGASISRYSRHLIKRTFPGLFLALIQLYWNATQPGSAYRFKANDSDQVIDALSSPTVRAKVLPAMTEFLKKQTPDPVLVQDLVNDTWSRMLREGQQNSSKGKSFAERFPGYRPLTNHREIEESFQIGPTGEDGLFILSTRQRGKRSTVQDAPDEAEQEAPNYMTEMGEAS